MQLLAQANNYNPQIQNKAHLKILQKALKPSNGKKAEKIV